MTSLFIFTSCEENVDQAIKAQPDTSKEITTRTIEDCDDCPQTPEHCCCVVEYILPDPPIDLLFCGIYPTVAGSACGPVTTACGTISGTSQIIRLTATDYREYFCVPTGGPFSVVSVSGSGYIRITCNADDISPYWFPPFVISSTPWYFDTDDCEIEECG